tara:strand:+ start:108 stop:296 length:189 start_codon:yes stop_codon:yes gene_type:complete
MYSVIAIFLAFVQTLLIAKMIYDIYKGNERIDNIGWCLIGALWCLIGVYILNVAFNIWSILR